MTRILMAVVVLAGLMLHGCGQSSESMDNADNAPAAQGSGGAPAAPAGYASGTVEETMDSGGYTYVQVATPQGSVWAAAPQFSATVGSQVTFPTAMPMRDYHSATLDRTFDVVYFAQEIVEGDVAAHQDDHAHAEGEPDAGHSRPAPEQVAMDKIDAADGGISVASLFADKGSLGGQQIVLRGKVVKFNKGIMGRNWLHLQDGTGMIGTNDITVTTQEVVEVGSVVTVKGTVVLDQDFGAGYAYDVMVQEATIIKE